eukprot:g13932.t1
MEAKYAALEAAHKVLEAKHNALEAKHNALAAKHDRLQRDFEAATLSLADRLNKLEAAAGSVGAGAPAEAASTSRGLKKRLSDESGAQGGAPRAKDRKISGDNDASDAPLAQGDSVDAGEGAGGPRLAVKKNQDKKKGSADRAHWMTKYRKFVLEDDFIARIIGRNHKIEDGEDHKTGHVSQSAGNSAVTLPASSALTGIAFNRLYGSLQSGVECDGFKIPAPRLELKWGPFFVGMFAPPVADDDVWLEDDAEPPAPAVRVASAGEIVEKLNMLHRERMKILHNVAQQQGDTAAQLERVTDISRTIELDAAKYRLVENIRGQVVMIQPLADFHDHTVPRCTSLRAHLLVKILEQDAAQAETLVRKYGWAGIEKLPELWAKCIAGAAEATEAVGMDEARKAAAGHGNIARRVSAIVGRINHEEIADTPARVYLQLRAEKVQESVLVASLQAQHFCDVESGRKTTEFRVYGGLTHPQGKDLATCFTGATIILVGPAKSGKDGIRRKAVVAKVGDIKALTTVAELQAEVDHAYKDKADGWKKVSAYVWKKMKGGVDKKMEILPGGTDRPVYGLRLENVRSVPGDVLPDEAGNSLVGVMCADTWTGWVAEAVGMDEPWRRGEAGTLDGKFFRYIYPGWSVGGQNDRCVVQEDMTARVVPCSYFSQHATKIPREQLPDGQLRKCEAKELKRYAESETCRAKGKDKVRT